MQLFIVLLVACALFAAVHAAPASNPRLLEEILRMADNRRYIPEPDVIDSDTLLPELYAPASTLDLLSAAGRPYSTQLQSLDQPEETANLFQDDYFYKAPLTPEVFGFSPEMTDAVERDLDEKSFLDLPIYSKSPNSFLDFDDDEVDDFDAENELEIDKRRQKIVFQEKKRREQLAQSNKQAALAAARSHATTTTTTTTTTENPEVVKHSRGKGHSGQKEVAVLRPADRKQAWNQQQSQSPKDNNETGNDILTSELDNLKNEQPYQA